MMHSISVLFVLLISAFSHIAESGLVPRDIYPTQCSGFKDERTNLSKDPEGANARILIIPPHLTNGHSEELKFYLNSGDNLNAVSANRNEELCEPAVTRNISLNHEGLTSKSDVKPSRHFLSSPANTSLVYFTIDGYFHEDGQFYNYGEYCILRISDGELEVKFCKPTNCSADLSKSRIYTIYNSEDYTSRMCMPRCCGADETLSLPDLTCRRLDNQEPLYFLPYLHLPHPIWYLKEEEGYARFVMLLTPLTVYTKRQTWNSTHHFSGGPDLWHRLHFYQTQMTCENPIVETTKLNPIKEGENKKNRTHFRLEVHPGRVRPMFLTRSRNWVEFRRDKSDYFCVDGADHWGSNQDPINQVVVMCPAPTKSSLSSPQNKYWSVETPPSPASPESWALAFVSLLCSILLILMTSMYLNLFPHLNTQGLIILSHVVCLTLSYLLSTIILFKKLPGVHYANKIVDGSSWEDEYKRIGVSCKGLAVLAHYFLLAVYFWLTVINADGYPTTSEVIRKYTERVIRGYSGFAWGIPFVLVIGFVIADESYRSPYLEAIVPDYAVESCAVASWSAGYYVHLPIAIIFCFNFIFILPHVWFSLRRTCKGRTYGEVSTTAANCFPRRLFIAIWFVQFVAWFIHLPGWMESADWSKRDMPPGWRSIAFDFIGVLLEPLFLFHVYCMNDTVLDRVVFRFPAMGFGLALLKKAGVVRKSEDLIGKICCEDTDGKNENTEENNDTVMIEG